MADTASDAGGIPVAQYIDGAPFTGLVRRVPILCGLLMLIEGMDTYGVGYVSPQLSAEYAISSTTLGAIHTATVFASLIGAVLVAPLSDRIGRRRLLIGATLLMAACTLLTCFAGNEAGLFAVRFLIGIGFGAAVPTAFSMTSDYAPARHRSVIIMATMSGIALGMALAGVAAALLIPVFGWKSLLLLSGSLSVAWVLLLLRAMPESLAYLVDKRPASPEIARIAARLAADRGDRAAPVLSPVPRDDARSPLREVVSDGRGSTTVLLWAAMSAVYALEFFTSYWLPTVLMNSGANMFAAGMISALGKVGSITGAVVIGTVMDKFGGARVLSLSYIATAGAILALGFASGGAALSIALIVAMFFLLDGSFAGIQALTAGSYPSHVRATGIGWVTGLARLIGGGSGTFAGGYIVSAAIPVPAITVAMATIMVVGAAVMVGLRRRLDRRARACSPAAVPVLAKCAA